MSGFAIALRPLRHYADFNGRSTRTELALFYLLIGVIQTGILGIGTFVIDFRTADLGSTVLWLALLCPLAALAARRLHDVGFSGWWLLPAGPVTAWNVWEMVEHSDDPFWVQPDLPLPLMIPLALYWLSLLVLLLWDDEIGPNRYGPNPRHGEAETAH